MTENESKWSFLNIFDKKMDKLVNWDPFLLSFDNFSCFNKVELIRLISVFEFCSSRVAAASVWPKILENILKILLVKENIGQMICEILQRDKYVSLYLYLTHDWPPEWRMNDSYDISGGARDIRVNSVPIAPPGSKMSQVQLAAICWVFKIKKVCFSWDKNPGPLELNLVLNEKWIMGHATNLINAALLVCSFPLALSFEIIWLYFCWCFKLKITNQNSLFLTDQSETGTNLISRNFFVYSILAWARSVKNFPSLKKLLLPIRFRFSHVSDSLLGLKNSRTEKKRKRMIPDLIVTCENWQFLAKMSFLMKIHSKIHSKIHQKRDF